MFGVVLCELFMNSLHTRSECRAPPQWWMTRHPAALQAWLTPLSVSCKRVRPNETCSEFASIKRNIFSGAEHHLFIPFLKASTTTGQMHPLLAIKGNSVCVVCRQSHELKGTKMKSMASLWRLGTKHMHKRSALRRAPSRSFCYFENAFGLFTGTLSF